ncbi:tetratricopeptide repeat protein [Entomobacter blattae]|uniref:Uncharacterized protein n=1 Tax=Entomobacter blattae TaxID=2762277 RepID=A0A7H1NTC5_9PROT|nr:hypothetical protein [Entomobacter blattae]QNT79035.1 hypothetical protein JGUZn3_18210 [Entomobacter blattae]
MFKPLKLYWLLVVAFYPLNASSSLKAQERREGGGVPILISANSAKNEKGHISDGEQGTKDKNAEALLLKQLSELARLLARTHHSQDAIKIEQEMELLRQGALHPMAKALLRSAVRNMEAHKFSAAMDDLNSALLLQPDTALLYRQRAQLYSAGSQSELALVDLARSIHLDGNDVAAWDLLSTVEEQKGDMMAAYKAWKHVLALSPAHEEAKSRLQSLHTKAFGQAL